MSLSTKYSIYTAVAIVILLVVAKLVVPFEIMLADRWVNGLGWLQIAVAAALGAWIYPVLLNGGRRVRLFLWLTFSILFFVQLLLGLFVDKIFLMSGELHFPVPMIIEGGFFYRLQFGFMPILFIVTVLLSGGAWCSHLCYFGSWDAAMAAVSGRKPSNSKFSNVLRWVMFVIVAVVAFILGFVDAPMIVILAIMSVWIAVSLMVIFVVTPLTGRMIHCTAMCPMGAVVSVAKYLNPVRMSIGGNCTRCMKCIGVCRYGALSEDELAKGRMGISCTMCGDCYQTCKHGAIGYGIYGRSTSTNVRMIYYCVLTVLWVVFVMTARI